MHWLTRGVFGMRARGCGDAIGLCGDRDVDQKHRMWVWVRMGTMTCSCNAARSKGGLPWPARRGYDWAFCGPAARQSDVW